MSADALGAARRPVAPRPGLTWLWALVAGAVLTQTALNLARPVTSYHLLALGASETAVGAATAAYAVLPLVGALALGRVTDRARSAAPLVVAGALTLAVGGAGLALAGSVPAVMAASAVLGMGHLAFTIAGQAAIARRAPAERLDAGFGWFTAAYSLGQMLGPLLSGVLLGAADRAGGIPTTVTATALWWSAGIAAAGMLPVLLAPDGRRGAHAARPSAAHGAAAAASGTSADPPDSGRATMRAILRRPGVASTMAASLALLAMLDILTAFLPVVGERHGVGAAWVGALLALRGAGSFVSRLLLPWVRRRWSRDRLLQVALLVSGAAVAVAPVGMTTPGLLPLAAVAMALGGLTLGLGQPLTMSLLSEAVPHSWRSTALAVRLMANRVGQVLLPAAAGLVAAPLGPAAAVWTACAVLAASGVERTVRARRRA